MVEVATDAVTQSDEDLKQKEQNTSPEEAQKNTRKAPPKVRVRRYAAAARQRGARRRQRRDGDRLMLRRREYVAAPSPLPPGGGRAVSRDELLARRERLARELGALQFDLGGLAYERAIRDHFRIDLLVRRAARLQEIDAELGAAEPARADEGRRRRGRVSEL